ncbi:hypothetical protein [Terrabacter sp. Root181]|uniref:hypothetical protein n=1 Tax=Terrabacter sp. Root181 TaxID=1736484 RepID=UPI0006F1DBB2|nr:hypothetical protein [Terrabacter sp. Root181]KRB42991.1 hypothetical protein ASD90_21625 [Terrabacter sp. Root181]
MTEVAVVSSGSALLESLALIRRKIDAVQRALALTTDPVRSVEFQKQLADLDRESADIQRQLNAEPGQRLGTALLRLDYTVQVQTFVKHVVAGDPVAVRIVPAPGIPGPVQIAVRLLLKRFLGSHQVAPSAPIRMGFGSPVLSSSPDAFWRELGHSMALPHSASRDQVADQVVTRLANQHVVIIMSDLDRINVDECLAQLWQPLVAAVRAATPEHKLVLLLVDFRPATPVVLPASLGVLVDVEVDGFPADIVEAWLTESIDHLPDHLVVGDMQEIAGSVVGEEMSPDDVLWAIYDLWQCHGWELERWLEA